MASSSRRNSNRASQASAPSQDENTTKTNRPLCTKWRVFQWSFLVALAIGSAVGTYVGLQQQDEDDFERAFQQTSGQVRHEADGGIQTTLSLLQTLALSVAISTPTNDWPLVTIPQFDRLAQDYMSHSHATVLGFAPLVDNPAEWEQYSLSQQQPVDSTTVAQTLNSGGDEQDLSLFVDGYACPLWQVYPDLSPPASVAGDNSTIYASLFQNPLLRDLLVAAGTDKQAKISSILNFQQQPDLLPLLFPSMYATDTNDDTWSVIAQPILINNQEEENAVAGYLLSVVPWGATLFGGHANVASGEDESILCVLREANNGNSYTYLLDKSGSSQAVSFLGPGDSWLETEAYCGKPATTGDLKQRLRRRLQAQVTPSPSSTTTAISSVPFTVEVYPTNEYHDSYMSYMPALFTVIVVALVIIVTCWVILCQDCQNQNDEKTQEHNRQGLHNVRAVTFDDDIVLGASSSAPSSGKQKSGLPENNKQLMKAFLKDQKNCHQLMDDGSHQDLMDATSRRWPAPTTNDDDDYSHHSSASSCRAELSLLPVFHGRKPVADLFASATVLFADIKGFTPWSSVRQPSQAFALLESLYDAFDLLAQRRRVFRVDTVGDSYIAVCGLPERRPDHAVALCHFARGCQKKFRELTHMLEAKLGPETSELELRCGINSGPIMAGILRGASQARFQLFGETVNTAAKIENAGSGGRIHISKETAAHLKEAGKGHWLQKNEDRMVTKKGEVVTYWLTDTESESIDREDDILRIASLTAPSLELPEQAPGPDDEGMKRLVAWNCEIMVPILKMIVARRAAEKKNTRNASAITRLEEEIGSSNNVLDEVEEVVSLPRYDANVQQKIKTDPKTIRLGKNVEAQLKEYLTVLAKLYKPNPFHCYAHASHVTMSTAKLLSRIVQPEAVVGASASELHDYTYGITSSPLTQLAVLLAALIHDVDHRGVPNDILCKEEPELAAVYDNMSVAEQNSVDIAWESLMDPRFDALRKCIYADDDELKRFRQLMVNCVMATDIFDAELSKLRKNRWEKAFKVPDSEASTEDINRKATIVIEHLIQASDVSHTMQHWTVYTKWNERLFHEQYLAYRLGRSEKDPSAGWYKGELWFFDNYVIPLANKLKDCGVFGVSSAEYLDYATANRNEWEEKGKEIAANMVEKYSAAMDTALSKPKSSDKKKM